MPTEDDMTDEEMQQARMDAWDRQKGPLAESIQALTSTGVCVVVFADLGAGLHSITTNAFANPDAPPSWALMLAALGAMPADPDPARRRDVLAMLAHMLADDDLEALIDEAREVRRSRRSLV